MKASQHDDHVFVNCPFDDEYQPLFEAIVFAVHDCGFLARCALEIDDSGQARIEKIVQIIKECRFGIHDISRTEPDRTSGLPRFNMPLELGIFLGARTFGAGVQRRKVALILDREPYRYQKYCSDIAGQDIKAHGGDYREVVRVIRDWLRSASAGPDMVIPGGVKIAERYDQFREALPLLCEKMLLDRERLIFNDFTTLTVTWLRENPWR